MNGRAACPFPIALSDGSTRPCGKTRACPHCAKVAALRKGRWLRARYELAKLDGRSPAVYFLTGTYRVPPRFFRRLDGVRLRRTALVVHDFQRWAYALKHSPLPLAASCRFLAKAGKRSAAYVVADSADRPPAVLPHVMPALENRARRFVHYIGRVESGDLNGRHHWHAVLLVDDAEIPIPALLASWPHGMLRVAPVDTVGGAVGYVAGYAGKAAAAGDASRALVSLRLNPGPETARVEHLLEADPPFPDATAPGKGRGRVPWWVVADGCDRLMQSLERCEWEQAYEADALPG